MTQQDVRQTYDGPFLAIVRHEEGKAALWVDEPPIRLGSDGRLGGSVAIASARCSSAQPPLGPSPANSFLRGSLVPEDQLSVRPFPHSLQLCVLTTDHEAGGWTRDRTGLGSVWGLDRQRREQCTDPVPLAQWPLFPVVLDSPPLQPRPVLNPHRRPPASSERENHRPCTGELVTKMCFPTIPRAPPPPHPPPHPSENSMHACLPVRTDLPLRIIEDHIHDVGAVHGPQDPAAVVPGEVRVALRVDYIPRQVHHSEQRGSTCGGGRQWGAGTRRSANTHPCCSPGSHKVTAGMLLTAWPLLCRSWHPHPTWTHRVCPTPLPTAHHLRLDFLSLCLLALFLSLTSVLELVGPGDGFSLDK